MQEDPLRVGYVSSVNGSKESGVLVGQEEAKFDDGRLIEAVQIGSLVKVRTARSIAFGIVNGLAVQQPTSPPAPRNLRTLEIDLFGEAVDGSVSGGHFAMQRGVSIYPGPGPADLCRDVARPGAHLCAAAGRERGQIGTLHQDPNLPACVATDELLGKHLAILGTTGSGKSCAVALILQAVLRARANGHVVLLDPHDEYARGFGDAAEVIGMDTLQLPYWLLSFEEAVEVMCSQEGPSREPESAILKDTILTAKRAFLRNAEEARYVTVDTPTRLSPGRRHRRDRQGHGQARPAGDDPALPAPEGAAGEPAGRPALRLHVLRRVGAGQHGRDPVAHPAGAGGRQAGDGSSTCRACRRRSWDVVVAGLCRMIFDFALWSDRAAAVPVLLVCEEAHRYIPQDRTLGFTPTRKAIARIAKEGRKYGVSLCLVTQRPSELSETILSPVQYAVRAAHEQRPRSGVRAPRPARQRRRTADRAAGAADPGRPSSAARACRCRCASASPTCRRSGRPRSTTAPFSSAWQDDVDPTLQVDQVIRRWRQQARPRPAQKPTGIAATGSPGTASPGAGSLGASPPGTSSPTAAAAQKTGTVIRTAPVKPVPPQQPAAAPVAPPPEESPAGHAVRQRVTRVFGRGR